MVRSKAYRRHQFFKFREKARRLMKKWYRHSNEDGGYDSWIDEKAPRIVERGNAEKKWDSWGSDNEEWVPISVRKAKMSANQQLEEFNEPEQL